MSTPSTFYLNAPSLGSATAIFLNNGLISCAPDGFYSDGVIVREQVDCVLLPQQTCPSCAVPCGDDINGAGGQGVYLVNLDAGTDIGAIIIRFDPYSVPDGIRATFDGIVYNKLTSPVDGLHQSSNVGHYTFVGNTGADCGISGSTYPALQEFLYDGTAFVPTGLTQSVTVAPGDVSLGAASPGSCMMVIPKTSTSPSIINFEMVGPCTGTAWLANIACPVLLTSFGSSEGYSSFAVACAAELTENYYNASLDNTPGIIDVFDFVYSDNLGAIPLANGFYNASGSISGGANWFQVTSGVVVSVGNCSDCLDCVPGAGIIIGPQEWTNCNLDVTTYRDGTPIPQVTDPTAWQGLTTGAWCYYNNDPLNEPTYGKLYNWYAVNDPRGLAPTGYHIPTDAEWDILTTFLGGEAVAGGKLKETGLCHWLAPNIGATNSSSFTGLPGGSRNSVGAFHSIGDHGYWWSSTENGLANAWNRYLSYVNSGANRSYGNKTDGFSVRLIKDSEPAIQLEWSFVQLSAMGQMDLYVNSVLVETRDFPDTGVYYVYAEDYISVSVSASSCVLPSIKANAYSQGLIDDSSCADYNTSFSSADYVVTSGDIGTVLVLNTFARCANACI